MSITPPGPMAAMEGVVLPTTPKIVAVAASSWREHADHFMARACVIVALRKNLTPKTLKITRRHAHMVRNVNWLRLFARALETNTSTERLYMVNCGLKTESASFVASALRGNKALRYFNISHNPRVGSNALLDIMDAIYVDRLKTGSNIDHFLFHGVYISRKVLRYHVCVVLPAMRRFSRSN